MTNQLFYPQKGLKDEKVQIPFHNSLKSWKSLLTINEEISKKLIDLLSKNLSKQNKSNQTIHIIYTKHKYIIKDQIYTFLLDNSNILTDFLTELDNLFHNNIISEYLKILKKANNIYDFTDIEIEEHITLIKQQYWINKEMLKKINNLDKFDFTKLSNIEQEDLIKKDKKEWEKDIVSELEKIKKNKKYIISEDLFNKIMNNILINFINDYKTIFWKLKNWDKCYSEWVNAFYWLETTYNKYDENIFIYIYFINTILEKNLKEVNMFIKSIVEISWIDLTNEEINLISYNSMKRYFNI